MRLCAFCFFVFLFVLFFFPSRFSCLVFGLCQVGNGAVNPTLDALGSVMQGSSPALSTEQLQHPTFEWVHAVIVNIVESTQYLDGAFTDDEVDVGSP